MNEERALSALPSVGVRIAAFVAILVSGLAGGLIGYSLIDLQCDGDCGLAKGIGLLVGAVTAAIGMAIVAVLVMRAMGEWREIEDRDQRRTCPPMNDPIDVTVATAADDLRRLAERLALAAGTQALTGRRSLGVGQPASHDTKSTVTDLVTEFDRAAEAPDRRRTAPPAPDDGDRRRGGHRRRRHDPGSTGSSTRSTARPTSSTTCRCGARSIAAADAHGSIAGAVYAPALGELFAAARGAGATLQRRADPPRSEPDARSTWRWSPPGSATSPSAGGSRPPGWRR